MTHTLLWCPPNFELKQGLSVILLLVGRKVQISRVNRLLVTLEWKTRTLTMKRKMKHWRGSFLYQWLKPFGFWSLPGREAWRWSFLSSSFYSSSFYSSIARSVRLESVSLNFCLLLDHQQSVFFFSTWIIIESLSLSSNPSKTVKSLPPLLLLLKKMSLRRGNYLKKRRRGNSSRIQKTCESIKSNYLSR